MRGREGGRLAVALLVLVLGGCGSGGEGGAPRPADAAADLDGADGGVEVRDAAGDPPPDGAPATDAEDVLAATGDADAGAPGGDWRLPALVTCAPTAATCDARPPAGGPAASYRPDFFYPLEEYPEASLPDPQGGRVQIAAVAAAGGTVIRVELAGVDVTPLAFPASGETPDEVHALTDAGAFHWVHVWPAVLEAGAPFFVTFHVGTPALAGATSLPVRVTTAEGVALAGDVPLAVAAVPLTWVTTTTDHASLIVHARNTDAVPHTLAALEVDGTDATAAACIPSRALAPGETALWTVPLCTPASPGAPWTVVARFEDAPASVGVGRVALAHYPVHAWVRERDCPFPTANADNFVAHREQGFDMPFLRGAYDGEGCNAATARQIVDAAAEMPDQFFLLDEWANVDGADTTRVARLLGDEVDDRLEDKPWIVSRDAKAAWARHPTMTTYIGGARHRRTGAFAGLADVQGFDIYSAACAPSMLDPMIPPLRAPYDYCRAVRANHAPGPVWFYSQGLHEGWKWGTRRHAPDAAELKVAGLSVVACGAKGLMYFATDLTEAARVPETWAAMGEVNRTVRAVRQFLREGDPIGARTGDPDVLVEAIRARDAIVVPVVNARAGEELTLARCLLEEDPHWALAATTVDVTLTVPADFAVADLLEVTGGEVRPAAEAAYARGRDVTIAGVALSAEAPYRVFVLAAEADVAERMRTAVPVPPVAWPDGDR